MAVDVDDVLARASAALTELSGIDLDRLGSDDLERTVMACQQLRGRLEVAEARVLQRWNQWGVWRPSGAKTAAAWLAWKQRVPISVARQRLRHAKAVRDFPAISNAWAAGEIDRSHVTTMLSVNTARTRADFALGHGTLLDAARTQGFVDFKRTCDVWELCADPDGAEDKAAADRDAREVHLSQTFGGIWFGRITLDPISGEIVNTTLRIIEQELFAQDWAAAKLELGRKPLVTELARTPAQRRADALVEMATRARTAPVGGRRPAPLFTIVVGYETFAGPTCELWNRTVVTPGSLVQWLTEGDIERIVFDGPSRVIDVGAKRRFFRGALRRSIEVRDRVCFHPSCDEPPERGQIDHIIEASRNGPTNQWNGQFGCDFHNILRYRERLCRGFEDDDPP